MPRVYTYAFLQYESIGRKIVHLEFLFFMKLCLANDLKPFTPVLTWWMRMTLYHVVNLVMILYKVRPLIESLNTAFRDIYYPTCELSVDERMVGFKGRLDFKQCLPLKPTKWGIKLWVLCEAKSRYILNFSVYCGKESTPTNAQPLGSRVVFELMELYYMKWHQLVIYGQFIFKSSTLQRITE